MIKKILTFLLLIMIVTLLAMTLPACQTLKTQATKGDNEIPECYYARYFAREGQKESAVLLADKCFKLLREEGCIKVMKENPTVYRDFNDCWKTRE